MRSRGNAGIREPVQIGAIRYVKPNVFRFRLHGRYGTVDLRNLLNDLGISFDRVSMVRKHASKTSRRNLKVRSYGGGIKVFEVVFAHNTFNVNTDDIGGTGTENARINGIDDSK